MKAHVLAALFICLFSFGCSAPQNEGLEHYEKSKASIESFLSSDMHDPSSLELELITMPLRLDTIQNPELFAGKSDYYIVRAKYRGNNALGAKVLEERLFYVTPKGDCHYSQELDKLSTAENMWLYKAYIATINDLPM